MRRQLDLARLVGPTGLDLGCDECFLRLDLYVEAELAGRDPEREVPGVKAHLEACPACGEEHDSLRALVGAYDPAGDFSHSSRCR